MEWSISEVSNREVIRVKGDLVAVPAVEKGCPLLS